MPYQITTTNTFIFDGDETNAGARAFVRDFRMFGMDGVEFGTAAQRAYLKDHRLFSIEGQGYNQVRARANSTSMFAIEGRPGAAGVYAYPINFVFEGTPGAQSIVAARETNYFIIDNVSQETPP